MKPRITAAAGLVCAVAVLGTFMLFVGGNGHAQTIHTCSATDRQFIDTAQLNMAALGSIAEDYLHGDAKAGEVLQTTQDSLRAIEGTGPSDPSLSKTRAILAAMFTEYGKAVHAKESGRDSGPAIARAYTLANTAHELLEQARPALKSRGCDPAPLL